MSLGALTWLGHSTFMLETPGGTRVLFDPCSPACVTQPRITSLMSSGLTALRLTTSAITSPARSSGRKPASLPACRPSACWADGLVREPGVENTVGINKGGSDERPASE
jgi:hypothetical protein